jgi:hypothetical protein
VLAQAIKSHGHRSVAYSGDRGELAERLAASANAGDVVIALGAGDINKVLPSVEHHLLAKLGSGTNNVAEPSGHGGGDDPGRGSDA